MSTPRLLERPGEVGTPPLGAPHSSGGEPTGRGVFLVIVATTVGLAPLLMLGGASAGFTLMLALLAGVALAALVIWRPITGMYVIAACAVLIEQEPLATPIGTDHLYIFYWPVRLQGLPERPIGFALLFILLVFVCHRLARRQPVLRGGALIWPFIALLACVAMGIAHGLTSGGSFRIIVLEVRPFWYLFISYLLAYNLVSEKRHVRNLLWILILGTGVKALQGVYIVFGPLHGHLSGQNEIMAHEQSYFFILLLLLLVLFALHRPHKRQLWAILVSMPFLLIALIANNRRADYAAFLIGAAVVFALVVLVKPHARKRLIAGGAICAALVAAYVFGFAHVNGSLGAPARALISVVYPSNADQRDTLSNLYRYIEDYDLKYTEKQSPVLGYGFGKPFLQPLVLPDISGLDQYYLYIPHNNIYWIWMRLGPVGYLAFWYLIGSIIVRGTLLAKRLKDPWLQQFAIFVVAAMVMEVIVAYGDYQFFFYRNIIFIGLVIGILMKLPSLDRSDDEVRETTTTRSLPTNETAHGDAPRTPAHVGSRYA